MKTTFKLIHLLSHLLLWTPNTPFASTPNPRRNLDNGSNFCYATSVLQAYADYLDYIFSSNHYPYQAPIYKNDSQKLKDQKTAYQIIRKAIDYIKKKSDTHPDLHTLLTLLNTYDTTLNYQKGKYNNPKDFLKSLSILFEIKASPYLRYAITPLNSKKKKQPTLQLIYFVSQKKTVLDSHSVDDCSYAKTSYLMDLSTYLWVDALKSVSSNNQAIPLVPESCVVPLCKRIVPYLSKNSLKIDKEQGKEIVAHLEQDIATALNAFIAANQEVIAIDSSMKTHMLKKIKQDLTNYIESVYITKNNYDRVPLENLYGILEVKDLKFNVKGLAYLNNKLDKYFRINKLLSVNNEKKLVKSFSEEKAISETIHVKDMEGKNFHYELASGVFSTPNYAKHYIAFVKHLNGYRIYNSLTQYHVQTNQLHDFDSLIKHITKEINVKHNYVNRSTEEIFLVYKKVEKDSQIAHNAHTDQVTTPKENKQATNSPSKSQSKFLPQASPLLFSAGAIGLASLAVLASKKYSKPQKMQALKNKKSPHPTKY
ncbi:MAG: hypothetical protein AAF380_01740 [Bacteroidota bacterium]